MVVLSNVLAFTVMFIMCLVAAYAALCIIFDGLDSFLDWLFVIFLGLIGFGGVITLPIGFISGFTTDVHFTMKNSDGTVVEKVVAPFEYSKDGNCFRFEGDSTYYCGWEVNYHYE